MRCGARKSVMPEHDGLMRIFWPLDIPKTESPGIIVGWRNSGLDIFVVAVLEDVDVSNGKVLNGSRTEVELGAQCRKCPESRYAVSKCTASYRTNIRAMWAVIDACSRFGK